MEKRRVMQAMMNGMKSQCSFHKLFFNEFTLKTVGINIYIYERKKKYASYARPCLISSMTLAHAFNIES